MSPDSRDLRFSVMFFACTEDVARDSKYRLIIESARYADQHGFESVWVPERHFTEFGYLYPNPAVLHAALARETQTVQLRAGSVVAPLHNPLRIAEEWAMVDNLSGGRIGISFASGWNPNDFAFFPERYARRQEVVYETAAAVQKLWKGESIESLSGTGEKVHLRIYPGPVQRELPTWITAAGNPKTFIRAGQIGANVLTHLLDHGVEEIAANIALYREARKEHGYDPDSGEVTVMLHTFLGKDAAEVRELVRGPYCQWLKSNASLLKGLATNRGTQINLDALSTEDRDAFVNLLFERFFSSRSFMGTPEMCLQLAGQLQGAGASEIACLLDFGPADDLVLEHLPDLLRLKELYHAQGVVSAPKVQQVLDPVAVSEKIKTKPENRVPGLLEASLDEVRARCEEVSVTAFYDLFCRFGVQVEKRFRGIQRLWRGNGEALAQVSLLDELETEARDYKLHPAFLDSCFQIFAAMLPDQVSKQEGVLYLPVGLRSFEFWGESPRELWCHAALIRGRDGDQFEGDMQVMDRAGRPIGAVTGFKLQRTANPTLAISNDLRESLYDIRWVEKPLKPSESPRQKLQWLIFADQGGLGQALATRLTEAGEKCMVVYAGDRRKAGDTAEHWINPTNKEQMRGLIQETLEALPGPSRGVVHLWSLDSKEPEATSAQTLEEDQLQTVGSVLHLIQSLASAPTPGQKHCLWLITRGAQSLEQAPRPVSLPQSPLWGFGRSCAVEHQEIWGGMIDVDPHAPHGESANQIDSIVHEVDTGEDQVVVREGRLFVPRLTRRRESIQPTPQFRADATYLVTGGLGGIGLKVSSWLIAHGARHLLLLGRGTPPPRGSWANVAPGSRAARQVAAIQHLESQGASVTFASVDVSDEAQMTFFFRNLDPALPPIRGILHAAGIGRGDMLLNIGLSDLREVLKPKVTGTWLLHKFSQSWALDFFVMFSSATQNLGVLGQGAAAYGAASAFLDAFAHYRSALLQPALSVDWGPWSEVGMAMEMGNLARLQGFGIGPVSPQMGTEALGHFLCQKVPQVWVISVDWQHLLRVDSSLSRWPFLAELASGVNPVGESAETAAKRAEFQKTLRLLPVKARAKKLQEYIEDEIAVVMGLESRADVDWRRGLFEIGMDSLMALELKNRLQLGLGFPISSTLVFDHPTVESIASFLAQEMFAGNTAAAVTSVHTDLEDKIAAAKDEIRGLDEKEMTRVLERKLGTV